MKGKRIALLVAAGSGARTGAAMPKQYAQLAGKPLLAHAVDHLRHPLIDEIRVVIGEGQLPFFQAALGALGLPAPITGGATRQQSVRNGLEALAADPPSQIFIHDAARPFLPAAVIERLAEALTHSDAVVPALPVVDSLARDEGTLGDPVCRDKLLHIQTPQAFSFDAILSAHRAWQASDDATDDAQVARAVGIAVATVAGDVALSKLTYTADFERAEQQLAAALISRTGSGFDVHAFADGEELWLGGLLIPHHRGLSGHSDADVLLHAITDALLGAIGAGDIGDHFPPTDPRWRGAASALFLEHARDLVTARGGRIDHVDATLICEVPRLGPHRAAMREHIAGLLGLPFARISIKATTTERLGFAGRGEGIAAQALATVRLPEDI